MTYLEYKDALRPPCAPVAPVVRDFYSARKRFLCELDTCWREVRTGELRQLALAIESGVPCAQDTPASVRAALQNMRDAESAWRQAGGDPRIIDVEVAVIGGVPRRMADFLGMLKCQTSPTQ